jgi:hypothetical protein
MRNQRRKHKDLEALSAYLDSALSGDDRQALEARLIREPDLRLVLENLRKTKQLVRRLPHVRAPRNYTLTPEMVKVRRKRRTLGLTLRLATSLAAIVLVMLVSFELLVGWGPATPLAEKELALDGSTTPAPLIFWGVPGMGGGGDVAEGIGGGEPMAVESEPMLIESSEAAPKQPTEDPQYVESEPTKPQTVESEPMRAEPGGGGGNPILGLNPEEAGEVIATSAPDVSSVRSLPSYWRWVQVGLAVAALAGGLLLIFLKKA